MRSELIETLVRCLGIGGEPPSPTQLGFPRVGHLKLSKSDRSDFDRERVGVRGSGLSIVRNPSPGSHLSMRSDLSRKGRGDADCAARATQNSWKTLTARLFVR